MGKVRFRLVLDSGALVEVGPKMVLFNYSSREVTLKIVYYGPGLCGKTTNLKFIYDTLPSNSKSKMISLATNQDRTLFFDFLPLDLGTIRGMKVRLQLYTVPGQVYYNSTRKLVLKGADGVVFVADSQDFAYDANIESLKNLSDNLNEHGVRPDTVPIVIQYNKRDLPNALPLEQLQSALNKTGHTEYEAIATTGFNVLETLKSITRNVLHEVIQQHGLTAGDTLSIDEIEFGQKKQREQRRTTMMDFDETPDSVWEDEAEQDDRKSLFTDQSSDEFIFEEVGEDHPEVAGHEIPPPAENLQNEASAPVISHVPDLLPTTEVPQDTHSSPIHFEEEPLSPSPAPESDVSMQEPVLDLGSQESEMKNSQQTEQVPGAEPQDHFLPEESENVLEQETPMGQPLSPPQPPVGGDLQIEVAADLVTESPKQDLQTPPQEPRTLPLTLKLTREDIQAGKIKILLTLEIEES